MIYCPQCGSKLKDGVNFCKYCGHKIKKAQNSSSQQTQPQTVSKQQPQNTPSSLYSSALNEMPSEPQTPMIAGEIAPESPGLNEPLDEMDNYANTPSKSNSNSKNIERTIIHENESLKPPEEEFPAISADIIDILLGRERLNEIKREEAAILDEMSKIDQRLEIGLMDVGTAKTELEDKKEQIRELKAEKDSIPFEDLPWEKYLEEFADIESKIEKLEQMKKEGKITRDSVYEKLSNEYQGSYKRIKTGMETERKRLQQWIRQLGEDVENFRDYAELTTAQQEMGELTIQEATKKRKEYEEEARKREKVKEVIQKVLKG